MCSAVLGMLLIVAAAAFPAFVMAAPALTWSAPRTIDQQPPFGDGNQIDAMSCPGQALCVGVDGTGSVVTSRSPGAGRGAWKIVGVDAAASLQALSCASASLCVATDSSGDVVTSTNPTGPASAWHRARADRGHQLTGVSCPSTTLCVAVDDAGNALSSSHPTGGTHAWTRVRIDAQGHGGPISCATTHLCVTDEIVGDSSSVPDHLVTSTDGARTWHIANAPAGVRANAISCPALNLCVGAGVGPGANGIVIVSSSPAAGTASWHVSQLTGVGTLMSVTCQSTSLCLVGDDSGDVASSTMPASGSWTAALIDNDQNTISALACATSLLCVAGDDHGNIVSSQQPTGAASGWHVAAIDGQSILEGLACPSASLCVALDDAGKVLTSTRPAGGANAWRVVHGLIITPNFEGSTPTTLYDLSCPSVSLCVTAENGEIVTTTHPLGGASSWQVGASLGQAIDAITCVSVTLCVGLDNETPAESAFVKVLVSTQPAAGLWHTTVPMLPLSYTDYVTDLSCASPALCVAGGDLAAISSTNATGGPAAWHLSTRHGSQVDAVSCPSKRLCIATDDDGNILTSTHPAFGPWLTTHIAHVGVRYVTCRTTSFCVAAGSRILVSTNPTGGAHAWHAASGTSGSDVNEISCASVSFCVAADGDAAIVGRRPPH